MHFQNRPPMNARNSLFTVLFAFAMLFLPTCAGLAQPALFLRIDTLTLDGKEVICEGHEFYLDSRNNWHCYNKIPYQQVLFEDDLYSVRRERYGDVIFTEKEPSWYINAHNGWLQYEYVNRQYYFTGKFRQMLRYGDYYYFVNPEGVDSMRIDQSPGNLLVKNTLPDIWDYNSMSCQNNSKWCDPQSGYGDRGFYHGTIYHHGCRLGRSPHYTNPVDTTFLGVFNADNQLFYVITCDKETFIAQRKGDEITKILDLGQGWNFNTSGFYLRDRWWTIDSDDNRLLLSFCTVDAAGLMTIDGSDIHIQYFVSPKTELQ